MDVDNTATGSVDSGRVRSAYRPLAVGLLALIYAAVVSALALALAARDIALVGTLDKYLGDFRTALFSPRAPEQRSDIAVVLITEDTLLDYSVRSPISGKLIGALLEGIDRAKPKAIGLDFIFDRRTPVTADFIAAAKRVKSPLVLGAIDDRLAGLPRESLATQAEILREIDRPVGHLLLEHKVGFLASGNDTIRYLAANYTGQPKRTSLANVLTQAAGYRYEPPNRQIAWQLPPGDTSQSLYLTLNVPRHQPAVLDTDRNSVVPASWNELLHDRVVLVGASMVDRDRHAAPLSAIDDLRVPGVMIHAQAIAQRIDGSNGHSRDIRSLPIAAAFIFVTLTALACFMIGRRYRSGLHRQVMSVVGLALIGLLSIFAFWLLRIDLPSGALAFAWVAGTFGGSASDWVTGKIGLQDHVAT